MWDLIVLLPLDFFRARIVYLGLFQGNFKVYLFMSFITCLCNRMLKNLFPLQVII